MKMSVKGPRLLREGWVPANPPRSRKSKMLIPKTNSAGAPYGVNPDAAIARALTGEVTPADERALGIIIDSADILEAEDGQTFLVVPAYPGLIDALATVGAELEDLEDGGDYERTDPAPEGGPHQVFSNYPFGAPTDASDDEPGHDREREDLVI